MNNKNTKQVECAGGIVINDKQEVVIVNQNHDSYSLPKGHVDPGENYLETEVKSSYDIKYFNDKELSIQYFNSLVKKYVKS